MRIIPYILTFTMGITLIPAAWCGETVTLEQVPTPVKMKINSELKGGSVTRIEKSSNKGGHALFIAKIKVDNQEKTLTLNADGTEVHPDDDKKHKNKKKK